MPVALEKLAIGRCYRAASGEIRKVVDFDGGRVVYVVEINGVAPVWNKGKWLTKLRGDFAKEAEREVMCL